MTADVEKIVISVMLSLSQLDRKIEFLRQRQVPAGDESVHAMLMSFLEEWRDEQKAQIAQLLTLLSFEIPELKH